MKSGFFFCQAELDSVTKQSYCSRWEGDEEGVRPGQERRFRQRLLISTYSHTKRRHAKRLNRVCVARNHRRFSQLARS